ncbi:MAG TPA: oligosaccharide flippase family protein [Terriglobia bacterium]|nr:oligosaccharide flippase family protein [Terriglobia bacterium]
MSRKQQDSINVSVLGRNALIYSMGNLGLRAGSFLLIPLYTHALPIDRYGALASLLMVAQVLGMCMDAGTRKAFTRFAAEFEGNGRMHQLVGTSIALTLLCSGIVTLLANILLRPFFVSIVGKDDLLSYTFLTCGAAVTQCLFANIVTYYAARNEGARFTRLCLVALFVLIAVSSVLLFVFQLGIKGALCAQIVTYGSLWVIGTLQVVWKVGIGFSISLMRRLAVYGFPLVFAMSGDLVTDATSIFFLGRFAGLSQVAIYSIGSKLAQLATLILINPFQVACEPFVYSHLGKPQIGPTIGKLLTYLMLAFAFVACGIAFVSRDLLSIVTPKEYSPAYSVMLLLLPGIAFRGIYYIGECLLNIRRKTHIAGISVGGFTILSVILNYLLIRSWGVYGAVVVFNVTIVGTALVVMAMGLKAFPIRLEPRRLMTSAALAASLLLCIATLRHSAAYLYYTIIPVTVFAGIAFLVMGGFFDEEEWSYIRTFVGKMRAKQRAGAYGV